MIFSITGIAYLIVLISMLILTFRLFQYWRAKRDVTSKLFALFGLAISAFLFVRSFSCLFFLENNEVMIYSIYLVAFFQALASSIMGYQIAYLKFPKISPWALFFFVLIFGSVVIYLSTRANYQIVVGEWGTVDLGYPAGLFGLSYSIMRSFLLAFAFVPMSFILFQEVKNAKDKIAKKRSLGLGIVMLGGMLIGIMDYIIIGVLGRGIILRDIIIAAVGISLIVVIMLTQEPYKQYTKRID